MPDIHDPHQPPAAGRGAVRRRAPEGETGRLQAHDPFELIRWLALSQPDPRKALAELVQNSLDAGARRIRLTRVRERGAACLKIFDDGEGVIPEMDRSSALRYIATHIGHSRKRDLSPRERLQLMTQGQYGIGLLGFWSLGETLEMRTSLPGQRPQRLILHRDRPDFEIQPLKGRLPLEERWTEVVVVGLHREAMSVLGGRRAAEYLALELRGQLLAREGLDLLVEDRMSRGRAQKVVPVRPPRFLGERLEGLGPIEVPGHPPIRLEVYLVGEGTEDGGERHGLSLYASGTLIADGFHELAALGLDHAPWTDARLSGLVDFPGFQVAPGSRRGVVPDEAAGAFARALTTVEPFLESVLESLERRRMEEMDRTLVRDLQRAFRDFHRHRPGYLMPPVRPEKQRGDRAGDDGDGAGEGSGAAAAGAAATAGLAAGEDRFEPIGPQAVARAPLLPPGPLAAVRLTPDPLRVECGGTRRARATALDEAGHAVDSFVSYDWSLEGPVGALEDLEGSAPMRTSGRALLRASGSPGEGALAVIARSGETEATVSVRVEVVEEIASRASEGIPEPELVHEPAGPWRSRMVEGRWQVNSGHREYRAIVDRPTLKLRYLAMLFAKEIVLRSSQDPRFEEPLEQLVEVAAYADRRLSDRRGPRRRSRSDEGDA